MNRLTQLAGLVILMFAQSSDAANCALRNPDRQIYEIFPDATSYRTVVSTVGDEQVAYIKERYKLDLAFTDRGKHTLYIVMTEGVPIGFVHARAEVGIRGSIELVWALDLDMRIRDFRVQRSREKHTAAIKTDAFRAALLGRDLSAMRELLRADGEADLDRLGLPTEAQSVANCVISCGLKTSGVTHAAFEAPLTQARLMGKVHRIFPGAAKVKRITEPLNGVSEHSPFAAESLTALRAVDGNGATLGILIHATGEYEFWCGIDANGVIKHAMIDDASDVAFARSVAALPGADLAKARALEAGEIRDCAVMALAVASHHGADLPMLHVTGQ